MKKHERPALADQDRSPLRDLIYIFAGVIGAWQVWVGSRYVEAGDDSLLTGVLILIMTFFSLGGWAAYAWHIQRRVGKEVVMALGPVALGWTAIAIGHTFTSFGIVSPTDYFPRGEGLVLALCVFVLIELGGRGITTIPRLWQIHRAKRSAKKIEKPIDQDKIIAAVENSPTRSA